MQLTASNISLLLPELNIIQRRKILQMICNVRLEELDAVRSAGWLDDNSEFQSWVMVREQHLLEKLGKL